MRGSHRKIVHATLYEVIAVGLVALVAGSAADAGPAPALGLGLSTSAAAILWNIVFNTLFERWEQRTARRTRTIACRIAHALAFEGGLTLMTVPLIAWWMDVTLWKAALADLGLVGLFAIYSFLFNWAFDRVFGLPLPSHSE
ncbi:MAG: PACE efflux transporter [Myxococcales bacterium]|nr:PACE efflux transporter [Myxococcales bacterium]MDD9964992.1 PACE efflux transporter [Myxococcales bacterium]